MRWPFVWSIHRDLVTSEYVKQKTSLLCKIFLPFYLDFVVIFASMLGVMAAGLLSTSLLH